NVTVPMSGWQYRAVFTDRAGIARTRAATLTVNPLTPTVSLSPVSLTYGTALANSQLGGTTSTPGRFTYTTDAGAALDAGSHQEAVTFTPDDAVNYRSVATSVTVNVGQATPAVTVVSPVGLTYGTALANGQLSGTATWVVKGQTVSVAGTYRY